MYEGSITVVILVLLLLIGVISYYLYDYYGYKSKVSSEINTTNKRVDTEKSERLGNVKSIVDQVNVVHDGIENEFDRVEGDVNVINRGIQRMMKFKTKTNDTDYKEIPLSELPGANYPDVNLLTHVTSVGGFTIKDLDNTESPEKTLQVCAKEDPTKCIKIPDEEGNVYLTNLYRDKAIALDGSTIINAPLSFTDAGKLGARISGDQDGTSFMETNAFGIGAVKGQPSASLHVMSKSDQNVAPFKVTVNSTDVLDIDTTGTLHTTRIELRPAGTTTTTAILQAIPDGLVLEARRVTVKGDLGVDGVLYQSEAGLRKTQEQLAALAPPPAPSAPSAPSAPPAPPAPPAPAPAPPSAPASGFRSGPIVMSNSYTKKPVDYMNAPYLLPLSDVVSVY